MAIPDDLIFKIAKIQDTPFYCYDAQIIRQRYIELREKLNHRAYIFYSAKANPNLEVLKEFRKLRAGIEVTSLTELRLAKKAGQSSKDIIFVGPSKSGQEIREIILDEIQLVIVESIEELRKINEIASSVGRIQDIALRINPAFKLEGDGYKMSGLPTQFGIEEAQLDRAFLALKDLHALRFRGLHVYLGNRVLDYTHLLRAYSKILLLSDVIRNRFGVTIDILDVGGGFGIPVHPGQADLDIASLLDGLNRQLSREFDNHPNLKVFFELGRYLVGPAGVFVTGVRYVKECHGKIFAVCDGGANVHSSAAGYGNPHRENWPVRKVGQQSALSKVTVTGPLCTPLDTLAVDVQLPALHASDLVRIDQSGAYGPTHSPVYFLSHGFPAELLIDNGTVTLTREPDKPDDIINKFVTRPIIFNEAEIIENEDVEIAL
ncbi:hypothetical protein [uncultured Roseibium sp.]|uniref:hypothetical protein n=1 Tax=uncultured Roseibium sp. TaxID=1936171 RepID=UPI0026105982|nr:hypothetical protein [uncultured Roseibium sp.]